jgi:hypothetical protein
VRSKLRELRLAQPERTVPHHLAPATMQGASQPPASCLELYGSGL